MYKESIYKQYRPIHHLYEPVSNSFILVLQNNFSHFTLIE